MKGIECEYESEYECDRCGTRVITDLRPAHWRGLWCDACQAQTHHTRV